MKKTVYWIAYVGKKEYKLTEAQYRFMRKENLEKGVQTFWFENFTISLPHVSSMDKMTEVTDVLPSLPDEVISEEKLNEFREKRRKLLQ